tara:strand:+ start:162 stop:455 length:294 start_codon:yes stop_codon:yes gene_type:complete
MKVTQLKSPRSGNEVPNQFEIFDGRKVFFQSYNSMICKIDKAKNTVYLDTNYWDYSRTTIKYLKEFLYLNAYYGTLSTDDIKAKIKTKEIRLTNLNK